MFEGAVAGLVNRLLGEYVQDLDTENLNVGIFAGDVTLTDLKLKPEALYELDLPIEVKLGTIGRVSVQIPWASLSARPAVVRVADVLVLAGPAGAAATRTRLQRAAKRLALRRLDAAAAPPLRRRRPLDQLLAAIMNNIQIYVTNVHIRYEDSVSSPDGPLAAGFCLQSLSIETTNSKWKPSVTPANATTVYQLMRAEAVSLYWNPAATVLDEREVRDITPIQYYNWKHHMITGLEKFSMHREDFEFLVRPCGCRVKALLHRSAEARVPRLLLDVVLPDAALALSSNQYASILLTAASLRAISVNSKYRHLHPGLKVSEDAGKWWRYAYAAVWEQRVRPRTWAGVRRHRAAYRRYRAAYAAALRQPHDTELKLDLQKCEDDLPIDSVVIAREHAKMELLHEGSDLVKVVGEGPNCQLVAPGARPASVWGPLSSPERARLSELVGFLDSPPATDKSKKYIEHKVNVTVGQCCVWLLHGGKELMALTLTQLMGSLETRPAADAYKISCRAERLTVEGLTAGGEGAGLVGARGEGPGAGAGGCLLAVDLERNPAHSHAQYALTFLLEPIDVLYVEHTVSELMDFFRAPTAPWWADWAVPAGGLKRYAASARSAVHRLVERQVLLHLNVDVRGVSLLLPEHGCLTRGGKVCVLEVCRLSARSELQGGEGALEGATCMELEERLYDRLHVHTVTQVLFSDLSGEWREARRHADSDLHLVPRLKGHLVFSNTIKKDYKLLPRYKLNVSLSSLKLNISDGGLAELLQFCGRVPRPRARREPAAVPRPFPLDRVPAAPGYAQLVALTRAVAAAYLGRIKCISPAADSEPSSKIPLMGASSAGGSLSEHSEEELEVFARTVDLPGFEDNISPHNRIHTLLRFVIGEVVINVCESRSNSSNVRPYLMLVATTLSLEAALRRHGAALQSSVRRLLVADRKHHDAAGHYLEILAPEPASQVDLLSIIYRKVGVARPELRRQFRAVERALVADLGPAALLLHAPALRYLHRYLHTLWNKIKDSPTLHWAGGLVKQGASAMLGRLRTDGDPPLPPGATKFSYSVRWSSVEVQCAGAEARARAGGLAVDCVSRADDRLTFRLALASLHLHHLSPATLYSKVVWPEEDCVLEVKYSRAAAGRYCDPRPAPAPAHPHHLKADGELRVTVGRIHCVCFFPFIRQLLDAVEAVLPAAGWRRAGEAARCAGAWLAAATPARLALIIQIHAPVLLLPQKLSSPNLLLINIGDLSVENLFKSSCGSEDWAGGGAVDNILAKLDNFTASRALMMLAGALQVQEAIVEPLCVRCDVKRAAGGRRRGGAVTAHCGAPRLALGQRDVATLCALATDNLAHAPSLGWWWSSFEAESSAEEEVDRLQAFLKHEDARANSFTLKVSVEGLEVKVYRDCEEVVSSPVREAGGAVARLRAGEAWLALRAAPRQPTELTIELATLGIDDIRPGEHTLTTKIFRRIGECRGAGRSGDIVVWRAPLASAHCRWRHRAAGAEAELNIDIDTARLTISIPFFAALVKLIVDALPGEQVMEGGVVNLAYEGDAEPPAPAPAPVPPCEFSPHDVSTPQCLAGSGVVPRGRRGVWGVWGVRWGAVGVRWRRPEVAVCGRAAPLHLLARAEILLDYSARDGADNLVISLAGLEVVSRARGVWGLGGGAGRARAVVGRCDLDVARARSHTALTLSPIHLTLTPALYHTVVALSEEISSELGVPEEETSSPPQEVVVEELWTGRKLGVAEGGVGDAGDSPPPSAAPLTPESVTLAPLTATIVCEGEVPKLPLLHIQLQCELSVQDCNRAARGCGVLSVRARVLDARARRWEPLLEPVLCGDKCYPWEIKFTIFQGRAHSISTHMVEGSAGGRAGVKTAGRARRGAESEPGSDSDSLPVRAPRPAHSPPRRPRSPHHSVSDDDDRPLPTLDDALAHLFTDESGSDEASESDDSSEPPSEAERPPDAASDTQVTAESGSSKGRGEGVSVSGRCSSASSDSGVEAGAARCAHVVVRAARPLQLTVAPAALAALTELARAATHPDAIPNPPAPPESPLTLINDIGPGWSVTLRCGGAELAAAHYDRPHSRASSPGGDDASLADALEEAAADTGPPPAPAPAPDTTTCDNEGDDSDDGFEDDFAVEEEEEEVVREEMDLALPAPRPQPLHTITISAPDFEEITVLCPRRCARALHAVGGPGGARYHLLLERDPHRGGSTVLLRSPLQVRNETMYALEVWCRGVGAGAGAGVAEGEARNPFNGARRLGLVPPHQPFNVPLRAAYHAALHFQPANENFSATTQGVWWEELTVEGEEAALQLVCPPRDDTDLDVFALHVLAERGPQPQRAGGPVPDLVLRLLPPLAVHNRLPVALELTAHCGDDASEPAAARREVWRVRLEAAEHAHTHRLDLANPYVITVNVHYQGVVWTGAFLLTPECKDRSIRLRAEGEEPVKVRARVSGSGTRLVQVYAPHWLANRTELEVQVRAEGGARALRLAPGGGVALWGAPRGVRLQVRAHGSAWSRPARLAPHAPALLSCPHAERRTRYRLLGAARPAALCPALTTVVTLEPLFVVANRTRRPLRYMEANEAADLWLELPAGGAAPFWPQTASFRMHVKLRDSHHLSPPFPIDREHTTVLRMDRNSALTVVVSGGGVCPRTVTLRPYAAGDAPLLLRNLSPQLFLKLQQPHAQQPALLPPRHQLLYTWDDPAEDRHLLWSVYHARGQFPARIDRDGYGEERVVFRTARRATVAPTTSVTMKLSSTLRRLAPAGRSPDRESSSGEESDAEAGVPTARRGRAVVYWVSFTEGPQRVLAVTQDEREAARLRARVEGHLAAVEVYVSLAGVGLSVCAAGRELLYASVAESAPRWEALVRQRWRPLAGELGARLEAAHRVGRPNCRLGEAVAVDLERMLMTKPVFAELRRAYSPAVWLQVRCGDGLALWHARLHRLQIDDQLPAATFPVALRPAPPPAGVPPRPFVELAMLMCEEPVPTIKYLKLIVQEFRVELDRGLLSHVAELARSWVPAESAAARLRAELGRLHAPPEAPPRPAALRCEALHVAPLKFSVSLSPRAAAPLAAPLDPLSPDATLLDYALDVWETSTLDARDVVFKVSYMEVTATWVRWGWVWGRWGRGAAAQLSLQGCAQLLGRDVLGNKFARAGPHPDGFLAYYEPHEGTLAVAGVARCRRALALCAAAPMLGRGAGAGGVPLPGAPPPAALAAPPPTPALAQLLADHCTGVCRTAWRSMAGGVGPGPGAGAGAGAGAGEEGGEGRAVCALRRAAARAGVQLVARARLPRAVLPAQGITEYRWYCAAGAAVWRAVGGGRGAGRAEQYVSHAPLEAGGGALLLLTSRRVYAVRCGPEDCAALWSAALAHLHGPPTVHGTRILFALRQDAAAHHFATATRSATGHCPLTMQWFAAEVTAALAELSADRALPPAGKS